MSYSKVLNKDIKEVADNYGWEISKAGVGFEIEKEYDDMESASEEYGFILEVISDASAESDNVIAWKVNMKAGEATRISISVVEKLAA